MEIADLIKKQQLSKMKKNSLLHHHAKKDQDKAKGGSLAERRKKLNLSIPQISMLTGIDQITLKRWETNGMTPDDKISQIRKYAKVMHLNLQSLVAKIMG